MKGLRNKPYEGRIKGLNLFDLHHCSVRIDLIPMHSILRPPNRPLKSQIKPGSYRITRRHRFTVEIPATRVNCRRYFYSVRVSFIWNRLPESVVDCPTIATYKAALDNHLKSNKIMQLPY